MRYRTKAKGILSGDWITGWHRFDWRTGINVIEKEGSMGEKFQIDHETLCHETGIQARRGGEAEDLYTGDVVEMHWSKTKVTIHEIQYFPKWGMFGLVGKNGYAYKEELPMDYENPYGKSGSSTRYSPYCLGEYYQVRMKKIGNIHDIGRVTTNKRTI